MNKKDIINIVIISLNEKFGANVATALAENLEMFTADCHEMIVYDLINPKEVIEKCGMEYFKKRERGVVKNCSEYQASVITISFDLYKEYCSLFERSIVCYLRLPEEKIAKVVNKLDFKTRDLFLINNTDIIIELEKNLINQAVKKITKKLGELNENCR